MRILVTRPEREAARTTRQLEAMGHRVLLAPLLSIKTEAPPLDTHGAQALVLTSRNAVHALHAHPQRDELHALPVLAVGRSTAAAAREAGFEIALEGDAGGAELAALIAGTCDPAMGALLHISGEAIAYDLKDCLAPLGFEIRRAIVYRSEPVARLPQAVAAALNVGELEAVMLMSPRTAAAWCALVEAAGLTAQAKDLVHLCLSAGVAGALRSLDPGAILIAVKPNEEQMLALAAGLTSSSAKGT